LEIQIKEFAVDKKDTKNVFIGLLIGALAGAATMLLFAPHSGKRTRADIRFKSNKLRDQTTFLVNNALAQFRPETRELTAGAWDKVGPLKEFGRNQLDFHLDRVTATPDPGKMSVWVG
jgi:gas vesicle protein